MVGEELERDDGEERREVVGAGGDGDEIVDDLLQLAAVTLGADGDDGALPRFDFLDVGEVFLKHGVIRRDEDGGKLGGDEGDDTVLQLGARVACGVDVADLFHLQRSLQSNGVIELPPEEHHRLRMAILLGDGFDVVALLEDGADFVGDLLQLLEDGDAFRCGEMADAPEHEAQDGEDGELRGEGLGGGDTDLGPGVHVDAAVALAGDGAGDVIADAEGAMAFALAFAERGEGVGGFSALADGKDEGVFVHRHVPVAKLTGKLDLGRDVREGLDEVLADHTGVARGAAPGEDDAVDLAEFLGGHVEPTEAAGGFFVGKAAAHGVADGVGLLVDLLEHVVGVVPFADFIGAEIDGADFEPGGASADGGDLEVVLIQADDVVVVEVDGFPGVGDDGADIAGEEVLPLADAEHEGAAAPRSDEDSGEVDVHEGDAVGTFDLFQGEAQGLDEAFAGRIAPFAPEAFVVLADEMGEDFRVGLGLESVALGAQFFLDGLVVLDDPIMHEDEAAALVGVRVGVFVGNAAVGGPACMGDPLRALYRLAINEFRKIGDASFAFTDGESRAVDRGDSSGIVPAILQPS